MWQFFRDVRDDAFLMRIVILLVVAVVGFVIVLSKILSLPEVARL